MMILSAKLMHETSVGMPSTSPFTCRLGAGKGSSLTPVAAIMNLLVDRSSEQSVCEEAWL